MGEELRVSPAVLGEIQASLSRGRSALEDAGTSAPSGIDGGGLTALLAGMIVKVTDRAASMSEGLAAIDAQVGEAGTAFWETDAEVASGYAGGGTRVD